MEMTLEAVRKNLEYLEHYGVKGQRWGVRRTPEQLGHILKKKNARHYGKYNAAVKRISELHGDKSIDQLSSKEKKKIAKAIEKAQTAVGKIQANEKKFAPKIEKAEARQAKQEQKSAEKEAKATAKKEAAQAKAEEKAQKEQAKNEKLKAKLMKDPNWDEVYANRNLFSNQELNDITNRIATESRMHKALDEDSTFNRMADKMKTITNVAGAGLDLYNKAKSIKDIYDAGKQGKAYAEIRQLMADGKYADVVKKSTVIADKDVENFSKRKKLLDDLRGPQPKETKDTKDNKDNKDNNDTKGAKDTRDTRDTSKEGAQVRLTNMNPKITKEDKKKLKEAFKGIDISANLKNSLDTYAIDNRTAAETHLAVDKAKKDSEKYIQDRVNSILESKAANDAKLAKDANTYLKEQREVRTQNINDFLPDSTIRQMNLDPKLKQSVASDIVRDRVKSIREKADKQAPLVLAEVGDFKINDFIVDYSTPRGAGVHA